MRSLISDYLGINDIIIIAAKVATIMAIPIISFSSTLAEHGFDIWHGAYGSLGQGLVTIIGVYFMLKGNSWKTRKYNPFVSIVLFLIEVFLGFVIALFGTPWLQGWVNDMASAAFRQTVVLPEMAVALVLGAAAPYLIGKVRDFFSKDKEDEISNLSSGDDGGEGNPKGGG